MALRSLASCLAVVALAGCGGGGGSDSLTPSAEIGTGGATLLQVNGGVPGRGQALGLALQDDGIHLSRRNGEALPIVHPLADRDFKGFGLHRSAENFAFIGRVETRDNPGRGPEARFPLTEYELEIGNFGIWLEGDIDALLEGGTADIEDAGAAFFTVTPTDALPVPGAADYSGEAIAIEINGAGRASEVMTGRFSAEADFEARLIQAFWTFDQSTTSSTFIVESGNMDITEDGARFSGSSLTSNRGHTGNADGLFVDTPRPSITGGFELEGPSRVIGSFGSR